MGKCHHSHGKPDGWTNAATIAEGGTSFISDGYWFGTLFDIATGFEGAILGLSWYAFAFGILVAILTSVSAAYSHSVLNTTHQEGHHHHDSHCEHHPILEQKQEGQSHSSHSHGHRDIESGAHEPKSKISLTWTQFFALVGDYISHTGDIAGPLTFVILLAAGDKLPPRWGQAIVQCGATLIGATCSIANVRTCRNSMLEYNALQEEEKHSKQEHTVRVN